MSLLNDLTSAMRRLPLPGNTGILTPASLAQVTGVTAATTAIDQVIGPTASVRSASASVQTTPTGHEPSGVVRPFPGPTHAPQRAPDAGATHDAAPAVYRQAGGRTAVLKAGQQHARWRNPFVAHAMPAVLQLQQHLASGSLQQASVRAQLALEVRLFRERLSQDGVEWSQVNDASYLLCTYLDEVVSDLARQTSQTPYEGDRSLLVEFHGDAWGGEDAFTDLERWMAADPQPVALLGLYELILSLGWQGRYRVRDRGDVMLQDLRSQLHAIVWQHRAPAGLGTEVVAPLVAKRRWFTASKACVMLLLSCAAAWTVASLDLDGRGRPLREALAAWAPPIRTINLAETLPPPLPQLLAEGWLIAHKHPQGWLLVFKSDGAFGVGKAQIRPEFEHNIQRLGLAFAPWPGDLEVIGHTDAQPIRSSGFRSNQALSEARAQTVAQALQQLTVKGGQQAPSNVVNRLVTSSGRGDTEPVDVGSSSAAYERNRRVDVLWKVVPAGRSVQVGSTAAPAASESSSTR